MPAPHSRSPTPRSLACLRRSCTSFGAAQTRTRRSPPRAPSSRGRTCTTACRTWQHRGPPAQSTCSAGRAGSPPAG
eukprot:4356980-Prymnesium_polylepis.2